MDAPLANIFPYLLLPLCMWMVSWESHGVPNVSCQLAVRTIISEYHYRGLIKIVEMRLGFLMHRREGTV
jgi:hypothetical protein